MGGGASRKLLEEVQLRHGESTVQGRRQYNEDRSACHHPLVPAKKPLDYGQSFFGVFDGHGGEWCAEYIANHLHDCIARQSGYNAGSKTKEAAILKGFLYCDERCLVEQETNGEKSGTTACAAIIDHTDIYVSNCGDCLAFGTQVAKADGSHVSIESLRVGDQVLDKSGHPTSVTRAAHGASSKMVELAYALGVQSVTPNHLVTLRWSSDPTVALHRGTDRRCSLVVAAWWERDTLERHTQTWRFVQPADETPANGTRVPGAILPLDMSASQARDFAFAWLTESERAGRVHPLHRGDLFDVRASRLVKLFASDQFRPHVSMPMCPLVKALRSSPSSSASVGLGSASAVSAAQEIDKKSAAGVGVSLVGGSSSFSGVAASSSAMSVGHGEGKATCDATPDIVYMLADAEEAPSAASRAFARQQIEAAWEVIRLDATALKKNVRITDLHATQAADVVWAPTVTAALALEPRFLLAFGQRAHHCWLTDFRSLPIVQSGSVSWEVDEFAQEQEAPKPTLHLTLVSGAKVQVLFASHPSSRWQFDSVVHTIARAHGVPVPAVEFDLLTSRQFSLIESVEYGAGAEYVSMSVAAADERFLLSDGSVTHNSRAILSRSGVAVELTKDHKPTDIEEKTRMEAAGGKVPPGSSYVELGDKGLAVARAFGNPLFKQNPTKKADAQIIIPHPHQSRTPRHLGQDEFLILATDGLWNVCSHQYAVEFVRKRLLQNLDAEDCAHKLTQHALDRKTNDNVTVVIVLFPAAFSGELLAAIQVATPATSSGQTNTA